MVVASLTWELALPGCSSLKEKRSVIRSLRDKLRDKFNVSVAETGLQDVHARAEITIALVASDGTFAESVFQQADHLVEAHGGAVIVGVRREIF
ncbi:MAG: DUF503 domain-containing protein [Longimicrobiales bacterium]